MTQPARARLRPVEDGDTYDRAAARRRVEQATIRETGWTWRDPKPYADDERPRMVDTTALLREMRQR